jgi:hypothetical protein
MIDVAIERHAIIGVIMSLCDSRNISRGMLHFTHQMTLQLMSALRAKGKYQVRGTVC